MLGASLDRVARKAGAKATVTVVIGYVQGTSSTANDQALSSQRAQVVAAYLRSEGVKGQYSIRGNGIAPEPGDKARRVQVTITYRR